MIIYFVTSNKNKINEFEEILGTKLRQINLDLEEIQAIDPEIVIEHKTKQAYSIIKKPVITEDTALHIKELKGLPGALAKFFGQTIGFDKLCRMIKNNRQAVAKTVIGYYDGNKYQSFIGEIKGKIAKSGKGKNGFGWDKIFIPNGCKKTFAEMTLVEKSRISMRRLALEKFKRFLDSAHHFCGSLRSKCQDE